MTDFHFTEKHTIINGHSIHSMQIGHGKDVVLLHGWGANASAFLFVAKALSRDFRVTLLDFAGFGESDEPDAHYGVPNYADDVLCLLKMYGIKSASFVGHSFGGRVAICLGYAHPSVVEKLVLVDSAGLKPRRKPSYYVKICLHKILKKLGKKGMKGSRDYQALTQNMRGVFVNVVGYHQDKQLKNIICPTIILWGNCDSETPLYMYRRFLHKIKNAQGFILDGDHFAYVQDSRKFVGIIRAFLKG